MASFELLVREGGVARVVPDFATREAAIDAAKKMARARARAVGGTVDVMYGERFGFVVDTPAGEDSSYWVWWNKEG